MDKNRENAINAIGRKSTTQRPITQILKKLLKMILKIMQRMKSSFISSAAVTSRQSIKGYSIQQRNCDQAHWFEIDGTKKGKQSHQPGKSTNHPAFFSYKLFELEHEMRIWKNLKTLVGIFFTNDHTKTLRRVVK